MEQNTKDAIIGNISSIEYKSLNLHRRCEARSTRQCKLLTIARGRVKTDTAPSLCDVPMFEKSNRQISANGYNAMEEDVGCLQMYLFVDALPI